MRILIAAGVKVEALDRFQRTALHYAADYDVIEAMRELILLHNANMSAVDHNGETPFDMIFPNSDDDVDVVDQFLDICGNKMTLDHGRLALHAILGAAEYSHAEDNGFHPPLNNLQVRLPLGKLELYHFHTLLHYLDFDVIRSQDDSGKLPIHIACRNKAPVEVLALILELDPATLQIADRSGALPLHECCRENAEYASVRCIVEQGGVGTLAARNHEGALPLHVLCGSTNPPLRAIQYLIESFRGSVAAPTNAGRYPFMIAACNTSTASLSVVYELVRASPDLVVPR
jgi:ankyrin repeat protein